MCVCVRFRFCDSVSSRACLCMCLRVLLYNVFFIGLNVYVRACVGW